jgi:uncharacterized membrane protein YjjP (DUF1212 family)
MNTRRLQTDLLAQAGRLLLEYNESTRAIHGALTTTSRALSDEICQVTVSYGGVAVSLAGESPVRMPVRELRYNTAVQARVHTVLEQVRRGGLEPAAALAQLGRVEADTPRHARWVAVLVLGIAAASLAGLLGADAGAVLVAGLATGLGLLAASSLATEQQPPLVVGPQVCPSLHPAAVTTLAPILTSFSRRVVKGNVRKGCQDRSGEFGTRGAGGQLHTGWVGVAHHLGLSALTYA